MQEEYLVQVTLECPNLDFPIRLPLDADEPTDQRTTTNRNRKSATVQRTVRPGPLCTTEYNTRQPS